MKYEKWEERGIFNFTKKKEHKVTKTHETHLVTISRSWKFLGVLQTQGALMHFGATGIGGVFRRVRGAFGADNTAMHRLA